MRNSPDRSISSALALVAALACPSMAEAGAGKVQQKAAVQAKTASTPPVQKSFFDQCREELGFVAYIASLGTDAAEIGDKHDCPTAGNYEQSGHKLLARAEQGTNCAKAIVRGSEDERGHLKTAIGLIRDRLAKITAKITGKCPGFEAAAECRTRVDEVEKLVLQSIEEDDSDGCNTGARALRLARRKVSMAEKVCPVIGQLTSGSSNDEILQLKDRLDGVTVILKNASAEHNKRFPASPGRSNCDVDQPGE